MSQIRMMVFFATILLVIQSTDLASAQNSDKNNPDNLEQKHYTTMIDEIDDLLPISIPLALIGVSLTGAAFLLSMSGKTEEGEKKTHILLAKKELIKGFIAFLICAIVIFGFDFVEILNERLYFQIVIIDIISAYGLFGIGLAYFVKAAKEIYNVV